MLMKRLVGVVTVRGGRAVQSFSYSRYLPLGRPEVIVENLDHWGTDEIVVQCIDRAGLGPDLRLLERISKLGLATPIIYAGGIRNDEDARAVIAAGADRIALDALLHDDPAAVRPIAEQLGAQAVIAALPLARADDGTIGWRDHRDGSERALTDDLIALFDEGLISEALIIDWRHEGVARAFDVSLLDGVLPGQIPLIAFGGLSIDADCAGVLARDNVVGIAVGNFLSYAEHAVQHYRTTLAGLPVRPANYHRSMVA